MNCFVEVAVSKYPKILLFLRLCVFFPSSYRCNGEVEVGSKALDDVLYRAQLELFPEALLVGATFLFIFSFLLNITSSPPFCFWISVRNGM